MGTGGWVAAGALILVLSMALVCVAAVVAYAALQMRKLLASIDANRASIDALYKVIEGQKEAFADAPALFTTLCGLANRQVAETAKLSNAAQRLADLISKPDDSKPYHPPADDREKSLAFGRNGYMAQGYNEEEADARALVDFEKQRGYSIGAS